MLIGATGVFLAEAFLVRTGVITAAFLARWLGPAAYGRFALATAVVAWVDWTIMALFARATVLGVSSAGDWRPIAATAVRLYLRTAVAAMLLLWLMAATLAGVLHELDLAADLRLLAIGVPVAALANAHQSLLTGLGQYRERAVARASRWLSRLPLIVILVALGLSVWGAILGSIVALIVELAVARRFVRPSLRWTGGFPARQVCGYVAPLFVLALSQRLVYKGDLVALKVLGATATEVGTYAVAQNLWPWSPALLPPRSRLSSSPR